MKLTNKFLFISALLAVSLTACNGAEPEPEPDNTHVDVFVLSGQSNMEGSTYWVHPDKKTKLLENYFAEEGMETTVLSIMIVFSIPSDVFAAEVFSSF